MFTPISLEEEDRLYWEVSQERDRNVPSPIKAALEAARKLEHQRKQQKFKHSKKKSRKIISSNVINAHGKRMATEDGDGEMTAGGNERTVKGLKRGRGGEGGSNKRVKVDPLQSLLEGMQV